MPTSPHHRLGLAVGQPHAAPRASLWQWGPVSCPLHPPPVAGTCPGKLSASCVSLTRDPLPTRRAERGDSHQEVHDLHACRLRAGWAGGTWGACQVPLSPGGVRAPSPLPPAPDTSPLAGQRGVPAALLLVMRRAGLSETLCSRLLLLELERRPPGLRVLGTKWLPTQLAAGAYLCRS